MGKLSNKKYKINEYGICTNPDTYGVDSCFIEVALFSDGKWRLGAQWNSYGSNYAGGGLPCGFGWKNNHDTYAYNTERECIIAGLKHIETYIAKYKAENRGDCIKMQECAKRIRSILQPKQLALFLE